MTKQYNVAVVIGRFQPLHNGHMELFKKASEVAERVVVLLGSANQPRTPKNPWTWQERQSLIEQTLISSELFTYDQMTFCPLHDHLYNDQDWVAEVQAWIIDNSRSNESICLVGHHKTGDESTYYLDMFPQWTYEGTGISTTWPGAFEGDECRELSATDIRASLFARHLGYEDYVPQTMKTYLRSWIDSDMYKMLLEEHHYYADYRSQFADLPYPPTFVTGDACVIACGHILLVQRKFAPGKGLYAIPGGFLNQNEFIASAIVRELKEETRIKVPVPVLHGSMKYMEVFDHPTRSQRGRVITYCGLIHLRNEMKLPEVRGADDADKAIWVPLADFVENYRDKMFDDHFDIVIRMKSLIK